MALNDITFKDPAQFGTAGTKKFPVNAGTNTIKPGEPVYVVLGNETVWQLPTNKPVVSTDFLVGIAASTSTNTSTLSGSVEVFPITSNVVYLIAPNSTTTFDTQGEYDALVGTRVLLDCTTSTWTILASDNSTYGCVIMPLEIAKYPGKVAFAFRSAVNYLA